MPPKRASLRDRAERDATPDAAAAAPAAPAALNAVWGEERQQLPIIELELREIMPNRRQPRGNPQTANLEELAASIREHGVIQPVIVRAIPLTKFEGSARRYELIAGERRWRASALAGRATIPALIREESTDHRAMLELALIENVQRQDLHPLDESMALKRLQDELGYSFSDIAERIGKSKAYVTNRMRLLQLDDDLRALVDARPDTIGHVYELARISDPEARAPLVAAVRDEDLSRAETRARVQAILEPPLPEPPSADQVAVAETRPVEAPSTRHTAAESAAQPGFERDLRAIRAALGRWEDAAEKGDADRAQLLRALNEVGELLERVTQRLAS